MSAPPLGLLVKPVGASCNLRCAYCFYLEKSALHPAGGQARMSSDVLAAMVRDYLRLPQSVHSFCWQGGEPTLLGLAFFAQVTRLQRKHALPGAVVANSVQTNATLVDEALAAHFAEHRFLAGCSLDGPAEIHDRWRRERGRGGSHAATLRGIDVLRRHGVAVDVLTLVTKASAGRAAELYGYLRGLGLDHLHFIPCVNGPACGAAITGAEWGRFLCELFDAWWPGDVGRVSIRLFEAVAAKLAAGHELLCTLASGCGQYLVVEHTGDVYPCDFYVEPGRRLGNVRQDSLAELRAGEACRRFAAAKAELPAACAGCRHRQLCRGDCPRNRPAGAPSVLCAGWQQFFDHTGDRFARLARLAAEREGRARLVPRPTLF